MDRFEVNILGCGSATPTLQHNPSSQVLNIRDKLFMVDCGEGTQLQFRSSRLRFGRLNNIFISHLHGDHCLGIVGLISTLALLGRTGDITIHTHPDFKTVFQPQFDYFCREIPFSINIEPFDHTVSDVIYEDRSLTVKTIPLLHRVPCAGFLFEEKPKERHMIADMINFHNIPIKEIAKIKQGADFVKEDGTVILNNRLTKPANQSYSYAYCSDTAYDEKIAELVEGVDLLYHEATFGEQDARRAKETGHSTAKDAARIAKLANAKKLMIGHFSARYTDNSVLLDEAKSIFPNTVLANEGLCEKL